MESNRVNLKEPLNSQKYCGICSQPGCKLIFTCSVHYFCTPCIRSYIQFKITESQVLSITCPFASCPVVLTSEYISLFTSQYLYNKYQELYDNKHRELNIYYRYCPQKKCSGSDIKTNSNKLKCRKCKFEFCYMCANKWHEGSKCSGLIESGFWQWGKENNIKRCPVCFCLSQKNEGCIRVFCAKCRHDWCWYCETNLDYHNKLKCFKNSEGFNLYWYFILALIFFPIFFPFFFFFICLFFAYWQELIQEVIRRDLKYLNHFFKFKYFYLVTSFFLSPIVIGFLITIFPVVTGVATPFKLQYSRELILNTKTILLHLGFFFMIPVFGVLMGFVYSLAYIVIPIIGTSLAIYKLARKHQDSALSLIDE